MHILVVDDERHVVQVVQSMLERKGHTVTVATDGEEALKKIDQRRPDLILLDIVMPNLDGATVAQRLRHRPDTRDIPVVFLTGLFESGEQRRRGPRIGGQLILAKPFDAIELFEVIELATGGG